MLPDPCIHGPGVLNCGHPDCVGEREFGLPSPQLYVAQMREAAQAMRGRDTFLMAVADWLEVTANSTRGIDREAARVARTFLTAVRENTL